MRRLEEQTGQPLEQVFSRLYWLEQKNLSQIAGELGLSKLTTRWMHQLGIPTRTIGEAIKLSWQKPDTKKHHKEGVSLAWKENRMNQAAINSAETKRRNARNRLLAKLGDDPKASLENWRSGQKTSWDEIAKNLGTYYQTLSRLVDELKIDRSLKLINPRVDPKNKALVDQAISAGLLQHLPEKNQEVLNLRFEDGKTLKQIGNQFGVSRERIRQIEAKAIRMIKYLNRLNRQQQTPL